MPDIEASVTINRPVSEVFRTATDLKNAERWQPDVMESYLSEDRPRVGAFITQNRSTRLLTWRLDLNADIIGYQPNRVLEYKGVLGRFPVRGRMEFNSSGGTTEVIQRLDIGMGCLYAPLSPLMQAIMTRRTRKALEGLKSALESNSSASTQPTDFHKQL